MPMTNKLPEFYEKYFEEKFKNVLDEIAGVKEDVSEIKSDVNELKKTVQSLQSVRPTVKKNEAKLNKLIIAVVIIALMLLIHTFESNGDWIYKVIPFIF